MSQQFTLQELQDRSLLYDFAGVKDPEKVLWELKDGEGFTTGVFYPVSTKHIKKTSKSVFKDTLGESTTKVTEPVVTTEDSVRISRKEYGELKSFKDKALFKDALNLTKDNLEVCLEELRGTIRNTDSNIDILDSIIECLEEAFVIVKKYV